MRTVYSEDHRHQDANLELIEGKLVKAHEMPRRADIVLDRIKEQRLGEIIAPQQTGLDPVLRVHDQGFVAFLRDAWSDWLKSGRDFDALPHVWPVPGLLEPGRKRGSRLSKSIDGKMGHYAIDAGTPITAGTWKAITGAVDVAVTGQRLVASGERTVFALCRPPGHHAGADFYGGYCFFNNAAIAAQGFRDAGAKRVAILDVDYHHGNGTQQIFYDRNDVLTISLHSDPDQEFPYYLGYADEIGEGPGEGYHLNLPLPWGTTWNSYDPALQKAMARIRDYKPDALVVSLGLDTFEHDPISRFKLTHADYLVMGEIIAKADLPTLFVFEGGYAVEALGINTVNVLSGFDRAA